MACSIPIWSHMHNDSLLITCTNSGSGRQRRLGAQGRSMAQATSTVFACAVAVQLEGAGGGNGNCKQQHRFLSPEPLKETIATAKRALALRLKGDFKDHGHAQLPYDKFQVVLPAAEHAAVASGSAHAIASEADKATKRMEERLGIKGYGQSRRLGLAVANSYYLDSVSAQAHTALSNFHGLAFLVDDLCFDGQADREALPCYRARDDDPAKFLPRRWAALLRSLEPPPARPDVYGPVEMATWENGRDLRQLSTPAWYHVFLETVDDYVDASERRAQPDACWLHDLDAYTASRASNSGMAFVITCVEVAHARFLAPDVRVHPSLMKLVWAVGVHGACVNDIFSHAQDQAVRGYPECEYNLVRMLMRTQGLSLAQAVPRAVEVANSYCDAFRLAEAELPPELATDPAVRSYVLGLKKMVSANVHYHLQFKDMDRYSWPAAHQPTTLPTS